MSEHDFAQFVRILGRGKKARRSLSRSEARQAMEAITAGQADPTQLGAFLMLLRVKEETPDELAGFLDACRPHCHSRLQALPAVDLDWPSYAGKKKHHPWFLLATILLAQQGIRTLIHGESSSTPNRRYSEALLRELGLAVADTPEQAAQHIAEQGFAYLPLGVICEPLSNLLSLRYYLGLRSAINTLARSLNPGRATLSMRSVFHPAYLDLHQAAAQQVGDPELLLFKGEGGELEIRPDARTRLTGLQGGQAREEAILEPLMARQTPPGEANASALLHLWRGEKTDTYGQAAIIQTVAVVLWGLHKTATLEEARQQAKRLWDQRDKGALGR